jgi:uncharacterized Zn-finger protein
MQAKSSSGKQACTKRRYEVTTADLPVSCPPRSMRVWDAHPRVYLALDETGQTVCPYCEALFVLQDPVLSDL